MLLVSSSKLMIADVFPFDFPDCYCICATDATETERNFFSKEIVEVNQVH